MTDQVVFLVDDDPSVRDGVGRLLRAADLRVELFESAREFLHREPADCPSCLVLDVRLPELSGLDLQEELMRAGAYLSIGFPY